ncbi:MAG: type II toxin-antitoxin system RelE/ParE family toxin [Cyanobacteria bacterium J06573_11]
MKLEVADRKTIGTDIKTVEFGWPIGMPTCCPMGKGLYEVRSSLTGSRIARVLFFIYNGQMILLHGFIKKSQQTPK